MLLTKVILPLELIEIVIDNLCSDETTISERKDLANCGLAARLFLPRTSMHLMKHIEVLALRLPQFLSVAKESTRLSTYCRELVVNGQIDITLYLDGILGYVPNLDSLELWSNRLSPEEFVVVTQDENTSEVTTSTSGVFDSSLPPPTSFNRPALTGSFSLSVLRLFCIELTALGSFLRPFCNIDTLELRTVEHQFDRIDHAGGTLYDAAKNAYAIRGIGQIALPRIGRLILDHCCSHNVTSVVALIGLRPTTVAIKGWLTPDFSTVQRFLCDAGSELQELDLSQVKRMWDDNPDLVQHSKHL